MMSYDSKKIERIREIYNNLPRKKEDNIRNTVVREFLTYLGYDPFTFDYEHPTYSRSGYTDIAIPVNGAIQLYVECKRGDYTLQEKDIVQLLKDLSTTSLEWGMLTNGKKYILFNNKIQTIPGPEVGEQSTLEDKIVIEVDIFKNDKSTKRYLPFFSMDHIFKSKVTNYFKNIAQYKALKHPKNKGLNSWKNYKSTLYNFFYEYSYQEQKYRDLDLIRSEEFQKYLENHDNYKTNANKWTHIRMFMNVLEQNNIINRHDFNGERRDQLNYIDNIKMVEVGELNNDNVQIILENIVDKTDSLKNKALFLFMIYMGPNIPMLQDIKNSSFDFDKKIFYLFDRKIPLPDNLLPLTKELIKQNKEQKYKLENLFIYKKEGKFSAVDESNTYYLLNGIAKKYPSVKGLTLRSVRSQLVKVLFEHNYAIEEISYLMNISLINISKIITEQEILEKVDLLKTNPQKRKHPFHDFLYE